MIAFIKEIQKEIGVEKMEFVSNDPDPAMYEAVKEIALEQLRYAMDTDDKRVRDERLLPIYDEVHEKLAEAYPEQEMKLDECLYKLQKYVVRRWLLDDGKRVDGRGINEIRPLAAEVGLLPRVHGTGLFTRGQTQVMTALTLGQISDAQILDGLDDEETKRYMHQYNFPSYSVGETRPSRGPGRREIGHGALAERALLPVIPSVEEFPYTLRFICASTLALMDAGVPIKEPVAGISCGLVTEGDRFMTMVDIQGVEDFFGDMDFKVAGTKDGITAIQMDLKIDGLTPAIIKEALAKTHEARNYILDEVMLKAIAEPRAELSPYAPKMLTTSVNPEKIGDIIGKSGKVIKEIQGSCNVDVNIEEDGQVFIAGLDIENCRRALMMIETIANDPEIGSVYKGKVTRLMSFGAFVEIAPGKEGLVHISHLDIRRVESVESVVQVGDEIIVQVLEIDDQGRINLSRRNALIEIEGAVPENELPAAGDRRPPARRDHGDRNRRRR